eukprot:g37225.t1
MQILNAKHLTLTEEVQLLREDVVHKTQLLESSQKDMSEFQAAAIANATKHASKRQELDGLLEKKDEKIKELARYIQDLQQQLQEAKASSESKVSKRLNRTLSLASGLGTSSSFNNNNSNNSNNNSNNNNNNNHLNKSLEFSLSSLGAAGSFDMDDSETAELRHRLAESSQAFQTLVQQSAEAESQRTEKIDSLSRELQSKKDGLQLLQQQLEAASTALDQLRHSTQAQHNQLTSEVTALRHRLAETEQREREAGTSANANMSRLERQCQEAMDRQGQAEQAMALLREKMWPQVGEGKEGRESLDTTADSDSSMLTEPLSKETEHTLRSEIAHKLQMQSEIAAQLSQLKTEKKLLETELRQDLAHAQAARDRLQHELSTAQQRILSLQTTLQQLEEQLALTKSQAQAGHSEMAIRTASAAAELAKQETQRALQVFERERSDHDRTVSELRLRWERLCTEKAVLVARLDEKAREHAEWVERVEREGQEREVKLKKAVEAASAAAVAAAAPTGGGGGLGLAEEKQLSHLNESNRQLTEQCAQLQTRLQTMQDTLRGEREKHALEKRTWLSYNIGSSEVDRTPKKEHERLDSESERGGVYLREQEETIRQQRTAYVELLAAHDELKRQKQELEADHARMMANLSKSVEKTARLQQELLEKKSETASQAALPQSQPQQSNHPRVTPPRATSRPQTDSFFSGLFTPQSAPNSPVLDKPIPDNFKNLNGSMSSIPSHPASPEEGRLREENKKLAASQRKTQQEYDKLKKGFMVAHEEAERRRTQLEELKAKLAESKQKMERAEQSLAEVQQEKASWVADQKKLTELGQSQMAKQKELRQQLHELQEKYDAISRAQHLIGTNGKSAYHNGTAGLVASGVDARELRRLKEELMAKEAEVAELTRQLRLRTAEFEQQTLAFQQEATRLTEKVRQLKGEKKLLRAEVRKNRDLLSTISKLGNA